MKHHPDKGGAEEEFKKIGMAWEVPVLQDLAKRAAYDKYSRFGAQYQAPASPPRDPPPNGDQPPDGAAGSNEKGGRKGSKGAAPGSKQYRPGLAEEFTEGFEWVCRQGVAEESAGGYPFKRANKSAPSSTDQYNRIAEILNERKPHLSAPGKFNGTNIKKVLKLAVRWVQGQHRVKSVSRGGTVSFEEEFGIAESANFISNPAANAMRAFAWEKWTFESERNKSKEQEQKEKEQAEDTRRAAAGGVPKSPDPSRPHASRTPGSDQKLDFDAINEMVKRKAETSAASADAEREEKRQRREMFETDAQVRQKEAEASMKNVQATIAQANASANASGSLASVAKTMQQSNGETLKAMAGMQTEVMQSFVGMMAGMQEMLKNMQKNN